MVLGYFFIILFPVWLIGIVPAVVGIFTVVTSIAKQSDNSTIDLIFFIGLSSNVYMFLMTKI